MSNLCEEMCNMQVSGGQHGWPEHILIYPRWVGGWLGGWVVREEQGEAQGEEQDEEHDEEGMQLVG